MSFEEDISSIPDSELKTRIQALKTENDIFKNNIEFTNKKIADINKQNDASAQRLKSLIRLPYQIATFVEIIQFPSEDDPTKMQDGSVIMTSDRHKYFLPNTGLVDKTKLVPGTLLGVNKDTHIIYELLPNEYDTRIKAMLLDEKPTDDYCDVGGLDKQIQELKEAVVLPLTHADIYTKVGIRAPKGVLLYGPPGTGKTLLARACAKETEAAFIKLSATELSQKYVGEGAQLVRDCFALAKEQIDVKGYKGCIIFIDELDAVGLKRGSGTNNNREVHRTLLELLNQLDGFSSDSRIKVIAATNRPDILDPALLRSGRLDRKIELPNPNEEGRVRILEIHSRALTYNKESVNFEEIARSTEDFSGAMLKAVCVEAGMNALRREASCIEHEDYMEAISQVASKKKSDLLYCV